jgi:CIC family chloride channel protein
MAGVAKAVRPLVNWLRKVVRRNEFMLIPVALVIGCIAGLAVSLMSWVAQLAHVLIYGIAIDAHLSAHAQVSVIAALSAPAIGGLMLGWMEWSRRRLKIPNATDPVEANALRGGRMSLRDSMVVSGQTLISNGCGASVGLEAGYTQIGAGAASLLGRGLNLRRNDLRLMVGCGAAGAIAAAFNAPLTGAFYACELIIGVYSVASAAPILAAAIAAAFVSGHLSGAPYSLEIASVAPASLTQSAALMVLAVLTGLIGIATMYASAFAERLFAVTWIPVWLKPVIGGLMVGAMAIYTPQVLAAGHGAMVLDFNQAMPALMILTIVVLKLAACTVSLASGFRGGLFFASLFVGSLVGKLYAVFLASLGQSYDLTLDATASALAGMATLGVAIVGGPLTMTFLVLEMTHNFQVTAMVLAACVVTSVVVRALFGHSFSTFRLHLRGETVRSADDVGWLRGLTVGSMMRNEFATVPRETPVSECRRQFRLGSRQAIFLTDDGAYSGTVPLPDLYSNDLEGQEDAPVDTLALHRTTVLTAGMNVTTAMRVFEQAEADILAVVADDSQRTVVGFLSEAYARRRYIEELNRATGLETQLGPAL